MLGKAFNPSELQFSLLKNGDVTTCVVRLTGLSELHVKGCAGAYLAQK